MHLPEKTLEYLANLDRTQDWFNLFHFIRFVINTCISPETINDINNINRIFRKEWGLKPLKGRNSIDLVWKKFFIYIKEVISYKVKAGDVSTNIDYISPALIDNFYYDIAVVAYHFIEHTDYDKYKEHVTNIATNFTVEAIKQTKNFQDAFKLVLDSDQTKDNTSTKKNPYYKFHNIDFIDPKNKILYEKSLKEMFGLAKKPKKKYPKFKSVDKDFLTKKFVDSIPREPKTAFTYKSKPIVEDQDKAISDRINDFIDNLKDEYFEDIKNYAKDKKLYKDTEKIPQSVLDEMDKALYDIFGNQIFADPENTCRHIMEEIKKNHGLLAIADISKYDFIEYTNKIFENERSEYECKLKEDDKIKDDAIKIDLQKLYTHTTKYMINDFVNISSKEIIRLLSNSKYAPMFDYNNITTYDQFMDIITYCYKTFDDRLRTFIFNSNFKNHHKIHTAYILDDIRIIVNMKLYDFFVKNYQEGLIKKYHRVKMNIFNKIESITNAIKKVTIVTNAMKAFTMSAINKFKPIFKSSYSVVKNINKTTSDICNKVELNVEYYTDIISDKVQSLWDKAINIKNNFCIKTYNMFKSCENIFIKAFS